MTKSSTSGPLERRRALIVGIIFPCAAGFGVGEILALRSVFRFCFLGTLGEVRCGLPLALVTLTLLFRGFCNTLLTRRLILCGVTGFRLFIEIRLLLAAIFLNCLQQAPDREDFPSAVTLEELSPLWISVLCGSGWTFLTRLFLLRLSAFQATLFVLSNPS